MKLTTVLLLVGFLHVSAAGYSQKITISRKNVPLGKVLTAIQEQSGLSMLYDNKLIRHSGNIDIDVKDASVESVLEECLKGQPLSYVITKNIIIIRKKTDELLPVPPPQVINGQVVDEAGQAVPGATVYIRELKKGTLTNPSGKFNIRGIMPGTYTLSVTFIGFEPQEKIVKVEDGDVMVTITLKVAVNKLQETVVTALGLTKTSKSVTYNVQTIAGSDVNTVKDPSFVNALTGKVAGVTINSSSAGIGGSTRVVMRGVKSLFFNNNVLYVVDGIPLPNLFSSSQATNVFGGTDGGDGIANFNPEDIESMSVLTGASAAALYGSQAANGVILITTRKGSAGNTRVNFTSGATAYKPFVLPDEQTTYGSQPGSYLSWGAKLQQPFNYKISDFFQTGTNFTNAVDVATGSEKSQTYVSAAAVNSKGIIPGNRFTRYNFSARNTSTFFNDKLNLDVSAMYLTQTQENPMRPGQYYNPLLPLYLFPRGDTISHYQQYERFDPNRNFYTQYWPYGDLGFQAQNPWWIIHRNLFNNKRDRFMGTLALKYNINDWLYVQGRVKLDNTNDTYDSQMYASTIKLLAGGGDNGAYNHSTMNTKQVYADVMMTMNKKFKDFSLLATIGSSIVDNKTNGFGAGGRLLTIPNFFSLTNIDAVNSRPTQDITRDQAQAVFFSGQLGYKNRLFLEATARNEWSSALAFTDQSSFFYPSVGLSGIVSDMVKLPAFISYLKVRTSLSDVGNAPAAYLSNPTYAMVNGTPAPITTRPFSTLHPEKTTSFEAGADLRLFKDRVNFHFTYYDANTRNQIFKVTPSAAVGVSAYYVNAGKVQNKGIEASLGYNGRFGNVEWNPNLTFTLNRNKIIEMLPPFQDPYTGKLTSQDSLVAASSGSYEMVLAKGGSTGDIYAQGLQRNADGSLVTDDKGFPVISKTFTKVGSVNPDFNLGFNNSLNYKNFTLSFLIDARVGGKVISATQSIMDFYGVSVASADARDKGGVTVNGKLVDAQTYYSKVAGANGGSTGAMGEYVYSATNVRLRELSFGYNLPGKWFNDKVRNIRISLIARNLWMIYNKAPYDPESVAATGTYFQGFDYFNPPSLKNYGASIKVSF
ncbi:SusC/RagA family TonB-linked outer membrane protein [Chitinophaga vietnamensis]|uniref:SusC/RagA family TonB-linked outer membrane protein n=1 Tax=Chitinophaga vietnamensis TaxID=2593957 RepID=UPI001375D802|nr:SusC/RagA family TonB-linked outer membrane protein [Chitinophaga vietnamensis]